MKEGVMVLAHGSKREEANEEIRSLVREIQLSDSQGVYQVAFMQFGYPDIGKAVNELAAVGVEKIIVMPYFLVTGNHISIDIPDELEVQKQAHPGLEFVIAKHLNGHPGMIAVVKDRIQECTSAKKVS